MTSEIKEKSLFTIKALALAGLAVQLTKIIVGRQRPHASEALEPHTFDPLNFHWHWHSFPSGHTQVMFTVATLLSLFFPKYRWIFFTLAFLLAFTRVVIYQHYFSDFVAGATIGYLLTLWAYQKWPPKSLLNKETQ